MVPFMFILSLSANDNTLPVTNVGKFKTVKFENKLLCWGKIISVCLELIIKFFRYHKIFMIIII